MNKFYRVTNNQGEVVYCDADRAEAFRYYQMTPLASVEVVELPPDWPGECEKKTGPWNAGVPSHNREVVVFRKCHVIEYAFHDSLGWRFPNGRTVIHDVLCWCEVPNQQDYD